MSPMNDIPQLTNSINAPLHHLEKDILTNQAAIECWLRKQWQITPPPFYSSVDLRNASFKLAPIDTNLFPAGFNNINSDALPLSIQAVQNLMSQRFPQAEKVLIIPEQHTRNQFYIESLATLYDILQRAGLDVRLGSLVLDQEMPLEITTLSGRVLPFYSIQRRDDKLYAQNFLPDVILLNNDLAEGTPEILIDLKQPIMPSIKLGWDKRLKSDHFSHYEEVAADFANLIGIDPWLINPLFRHCDNLDFMSGEGIDVLAENARDLFHSIQKKYDDYGIKEPPFIIIKADAGTYGMGIMSIKSADELANLNRKQRTRMAVTKGKQSVTRVILQEGIYTQEIYQNGVAEPVVYMIGENVISGFYRIHNERSNTENLNAPGMHFVPLAFASNCLPPPSNIDAPEISRFYVYGVIARLAALAAAREIYTAEGIVHGR